MSGTCKKIIIIIIVPQVRRCVQRQRLLGIVEFGTRNEKMYQNLSEFIVGSKTRD